MKNIKLILLLAVVMVIALGAVSCSESSKYTGENKEGQSDRVNAIETSYTVVEASEEYGGVNYVFPKIEGMTNLSKQADANGSMKRLNTKTAKDNNGDRGAISDSYEVMIANDKIFSIIFPTTLEINIPTRALVMLVESHKFIYSIDNLFGKVDTNDMFADARAVFEAAGADATQTDELFSQNYVYFTGDDMQDLELHMTYFTDKSYDIVVPFPDVKDYLIEDKVELFAFTD